MLFKDEQAFVVVPELVVANHNFRALDVQAEDASRVVGALVVDQTSLARFRVDDALHLRQVNGTRLNLGVVLIDVLQLVLRRIRIIVCEVIERGFCGRISVQEVIIVRPWSIQVVPE